VVTASGGRKLSYKSMNAQINTIDFNERPFIAIWEVTRACGLACVNLLRFRPAGSSSEQRRNQEAGTSTSKWNIEPFRWMQIAAENAPSKLPKILREGTNRKDPGTNRLLEQNAHAQECDEQDH
jgi:hypothetical protein